MLEHFPKFNGWKCSLNGLWEIVCSLCISGIIISHPFVLSFSTDSGRNTWVQNRFTNEEKRQKQKRWNKFWQGKGLYLRVSSHFRYVGGWLLGFGLIFVYLLNFSHSILLSLIPFVSVLWSSLLWICSIKQTHFTSIYAGINFPYFWIFSYP